MEYTVKCICFGDCSVLTRANDHQLIVDCGTDSRDPVTKCSCSVFAHSAIAAELSAPLPPDALITHLHGDHFRGFLPLPASRPLPLRTIYLPYLISDGRFVFAGALARLSVTAPPRSFGLRSTKEIEELLGLLPRISCNLQLVQDGDVIGSGSEELEVLWPRVEYSLKKLVLPGGQTFLHRDEELRQQYEALLSGVQDLSQEERSAFSRLYEYGNSLEHALSICLSPSDREGSLSSVTDALKALEDARQFFWAHNTKQSDFTWFQRYLFLFSRAQYHALIKGINATSVVCHQKERILLLGDVPPAVVELLHSEGKFSSKYTVVKLPHHGTDTHYKSAGPLPNAEYYIISNGGHSRRRVGCKMLTGLSSAYPGSVFHCTDAHRDGTRYCKYVANTRGSCHRACSPIPGKELTLPV